MTDDDLRRDVAAELSWDPKVGSQAIVVSADAVLHARELSAETISYGTVILAGTVNSWAEHREAVAAAWSAPGVTEIDDQIVVEY